MRFLVTSWFCFAASLPARARRKARRWSAALRSPIPGLARTRSRTIWPGPRPPADADRPTRRSPTASCSRCRRWLPSARRSTTSSIDTSPGTRPIFRTKPSASERSYDFQLFDRTLLYSPDSRFVLAGIVNRMDRAYLSEANCGEIRLIYRLTRTDAPATGDNATSPRLPMTLNVVLKAKGDNAIDGSGKAITCAEIARRWLAAGESVADRRRACGETDVEGWPARSDRGLKTSTASKPIFRSRTRRNPAIRDFRTDYLLKVFRLQRAVRERSRKRRSKTRSIASGFWRMKSSSATSRRGCSIPGISASSIAARS